MGLLALLVGSAGPGPALLAKPRVPPGVSDLPLVRVLPAPELRLNGDVDSNSPAVWDLVDGVPRLHVFTSTHGVARRSEGASIEDLTPASPVRWSLAPEQGVWMEAVVTDESGAWYGYYHNERAGVVCDDSGKVLPRIGAARSGDRGLTWDDLGPVLEAPIDTHVCETTNQYFLGGVGDPSVMLDPDRQYLYIFYSQYIGELSGQGVVIARLAWADRDGPASRLEIWNQGAWLPLGDALDLAATPLFPTTRSWHDPEGVADGFWGPAVHWNSFVDRYVMLLNRTADVGFAQAGIYISFSDALDDPARWSPPRLLLEGGAWYPQVMGLGADGTDKSAGQVARLFMMGSSSHLLEFRR